MVAPVVVFSVIFIYMINYTAPNNTIILLPDDNGSIGEVIVANQSGSQTINSAYTAIKVKDANSVIDTPIVVDKDEVLEMFKSSLSSQPTKVKNYILYFNAGTTELTTESQKRIPEIISELSNRKIYELYIIGHTDTVGKADTNYRFGLKRADTVKQIITQHFPGNKNFTLSSHGEGDLLIPTDDEVDEAQNRRVEIEIH